MMETNEFGTRLNSLRKQAGLSLRDLADKIGTNFTYLSKIENGAMPPPSEQVISRLAEVLDADREELMLLAGKISGDISSILQKRGAMKVLKVYNRLSEVPKMINMKNVRKVGRIATPIVLVIAIASSLLLAAPLPAKAVDFTFTPASPTATSGSPMNFSFTIHVQNADKLPIVATGVVFTDNGKPMAPGLIDAYMGLPMNATASPITMESLPLSPKYITVSATTGAGWGSASPGGRYGYGYGYSIASSSWLDWGTHDFTGDFGYGYGYDSYVGETSITYNITWTPPSIWPAGTYYITAIVAGKGGEEPDLLFETIPFTISQAYYGAPAAPPPEPEETDPGVWDVSSVVTANGEFTADVTVKSADDKLTLGINSGTTGTTAGGGALSTITITELETPPAPPAGANIIGLAYDIDAGDATFDQEITLTFTYDPADIPEGVSEEDLVIALWDEVAGEWVELTCVVDPETNTITAQLSHLSKYAVMTRVVAEEEAPVPVLYEEEEEPVIIEEEEPVIEEEKPVVEEEKPAVVEKPAVEEEEEPAGGIAWWVWLIIGIAVVVVIGLLYYYWWRPRTA